MTPEANKANNIQMQRLWVKLHWSFHPLNPPWVILMIGNKSFSVIKSVNMNSIYGMVSYISSCPSTHLTSHHKEVLKLTCVHKYVHIYLQLSTLVLNSESHPPNCLQSNLHQDGSFKSLGRHSYQLTWVNRVARPLPPCEQVSGSTQAPGSLRLILAVQKEEQAKNNPCPVPTFIPNSRIEPSIHYLFNQ